MTHIISTRKNGIAVLDHYTPSEFVVYRELISGRDASTNSVARLFVNGQLTMSDGSHERRTNYEVVCRATGDALIAGLGIGMILIPMLTKPEVLSVTVIEKYQDVIDMCHN